MLVLVFSLGLDLIIWSWYFYFFVCCLFSRVVFCCLLCFVCLCVFLLCVGVLCLKFRALCFVLCFFIYVAFSCFRVFFVIFFVNSLRIALLLLLSGPVVSVQVLRGSSARAGRAAGSPISAESRQGFARRARKDKRVFPLGASARV